MSRELDLEHFEKLLQEKRKEVLEEIRDIEPKVEGNPLNEGEENTPFPTHIADIADVESRRDRDSYILDHLSTTFKEINLSLEKIIEGEYGKCEKCGEKINVERLEAIPYTRYCKECAEKKERFNWQNQRKKL